MKKTLAEFLKVVPAKESLFLAICLWSGVPASAGTSVTADAIRVDLRPSPRSASPARTERLAWDVRWAEPGANAARVDVVRKDESAESFSEGAGDTPWKPDHGGLFEFSLDSFDESGSRLGEPLYASFIAPDETIRRRALSEIDVSATGGAEASAPVVTLAHAVIPETGWHTVFTCTNLMLCDWVAAENSRETGILLAGSGRATVSLDNWPGDVRFFTLVTSLYRSFVRGERVDIQINEHSEE